MALRDWNPFARRPEEALDPALLNALADLERLAAERPEFGPAAGSLAPLLRAAFHPKVAPVALHAEPEVIVAAWRAGIPAFRAGERGPALDPDEFGSRVAGILDVLCETNEQARRLRDAIESDQVNFIELSNAALEGDFRSIEAAVDSQALDLALVRSVLRLALLPDLAAYSTSLARIRPEGSWTKGECPHCGGPPVLGESRGLEQRRYWRCGVCAADWAGDRLKCPFCGETDHRRLSYRFVEGEPDRYRLCLCETCGKCVPIVATLGPISAPGLLVAELAVSHLLIDADD